MFCIFYQNCPKSVDNGNCSVYLPEGVVSVNKHYRPCGFLDTSVYTFEKKREVKKINPLKQSKRGK